MTPLLGIKVVDFSHVIAGPFATFYLAQLGATVTKVEAPGDGDMMRRMKGGASSFESLNAGKKFEQIDISTTQGRDAVLEMAAQADVFVDNYRPGVLDRHGLGYAAVRAINPRIVYCAISGYGHASAGVARRGAYDHVIQGLTGMTMVAGVEGDPPIKTGFPAVDTSTGIVGALAIVSALRERDRTGDGCMLDVSMWAVALQLMYPIVCEALNTGEAAERVGNQGYSGSPAADIFQCCDGWIAIGANTNAQLKKLTTALDIDPIQLEGIVQADGLANSGLAKASNPSALKAMLRQAIAVVSAAELEQRLNDAGVPAARVRTVPEFVAEYRDMGLLRPLALGEGSTLSPGLGWRVVQAHDLMVGSENP
jgi:crotonobetainyl-CoA:carnitine CoA-transferase CaiB-like acyl-CoA transferase